MLSLGYISGVRRKSLGVRYESRGPVVDVRG